MDHRLSWIADVAQPVTGVPELANKSRSILVSPARCHRRVAVSEELMAVSNQPSHE
jgi:hypothetical protein